GRRRRPAGTAAAGGLASSRTSARSVRLLACSPMTRAVSRQTGVEGATARTIVPPDTVLSTAKRVFMATGSLEMRALARELGIGRATLYRWNRGREELLSEVLASLAAGNMRRAESEVATPPGALRVCHVHDLHIR